MPRPHRAADEQRDPRPRGKPTKKPEAVRIRLLGGFRVSVGERSIGEAEWRLKKAASLVKLLALEPGHRMHRERLMDLLWPELDARAAANNLHRTLHFARRTLEPDLATASCYLRLHGDLLALCPNALLWVDVESFEEAGGRHPWLGTRQHTGRLSICTPESSCPRTVTRAGRRRDGKICG